MPGALAATHLIAIGYLGLIMCGALLQMLPVVAGAPVPAVRLVGMATHLLLTIGAAGLAWGLAGGGPTLIRVGAGAAALGFLVFVVPVSIALVRARCAPGTSLALARPRWPWRSGSLWGCCWSPSSKGGSGLRSIAVGSIRTPRGG